jgi:hypothetical protein
MSETSADSRAIQEQKGDPVGLFVSVGKTVALRWKKINPEELEKYKKMAEDDMERYQNEMTEYRLREAQKRHKSEEQAAFKPLSSLPGMGMDLDRTSAMMLPAHFLNHQHNLALLSSDVHNQNMGNDNLIQNLLRGMLPARSNNISTAVDLMTQGSSGERLGNDDILSSLSSLLQRENPPSSLSQQLHQHQQQLLRQQQEQNSKLNVGALLQILQREELRRQEQIRLQQQQLHRDENELLQQLLRQNMRQPTMHDIAGAYPSNQLNQQVLLNEVSQAGQQRGSGDAMANLLSYIQGGSNGLEPQDNRASNVPNTVAAMLALNQLNARPPNKDDSSSSISE